MRYAHEAGVSLREAWRHVRGHDPGRRTFTHGKVHHRRHDLTHRRRHDPRRRRHDPAFGAGRGVVGKLINGVVFAASAVIGKTASGYVNNAVPQANIPVPGTTKAVNLASFLGGAALAGFGPNSGIMGEVVDGFAGGLAGGSDPVASSLGGGAMRPMGPQLYGTLGV